MRSNFYIQDFFQAVPSDYFHGKEGIFIVDTFDPISYKLVKNHLCQNIVFHHKNFDEVTKDWIESEFQNLGFFNQNDHFFIHQADRIKIDLLRLIVQLQITGRVIVLSFDGSLDLIKKLEKDSQLTSLIIDPPRFWETQKLLEFCFQHFRLSLTHEAKEWMMNFIPADFFSYYNSCAILDLNFQHEKKIERLDVETVLKKEKFDQFELAQLFCRKKMKDFTARLLEVETSFEHYRSLFNFMQSHLIKVKDPSYLKSKPKLSQYDKDIQQFHQVWRQDELLKWIEFFNNLEILAKKKDTSLHQKVQHLHAKLINP